MSRQNKMCTPCNKAGHIINFFSGFTPWKEKFMKQREPESSSIWKEANAIVGSSDSTMSTIEEKKRLVARHWQSSSLLE